MDNIIIAQDTFIIYGAESCPACKQVIQLLNSKDRQFVYKSFGKDYELQELIDLGITSRSVPQVFVVTECNVLKHIGGLIETVKFLKNN